MDTLRPASLSDAINAVNAVNAVNADGDRWPIFLCRFWLCNCCWIGRCALLMQLMFRLVVGYTSGQV